MPLVQPRAGLVNRGDLQDLDDSVRESIESGDVRGPDTSTTQEVRAGGVSFAPNSDVSFSTMAATVPGTLPGDSGDTNYEAFRYYWIETGDPVVLDAEHALKSEDHSLYAGNEAINTGIPIWDRVNGRVCMGAVGAQQYDLIIQMTRKAVGPGELWYLVWRMLALSNDLVPSAFEVGGGLWQKSGRYEGYAKGDPFDLQYVIEGAAGGVSVNYRALAETDSGFSILSNILNVPNSPAVLSSNNYNKVFYGAGPGFLKYIIYKEYPPATFARVHEVRNSTDLQFNDIGDPGIAEVGWPVEPIDRPLAYAQTSDSIVGAFGGAFVQNRFAVLVPGTYDSDDTENDGQYIRVTFLSPTAVDRQIALDKFFWGTTFNAWAPDPDIVFSDKLPPTIAIPSVSPSAGNPGPGGVFDPPDPGSGGGPCIVTKVGRRQTPVMVWQRIPRRLKSVYHRIMVPYTETKDFGELIEGDLAHPYAVKKKRIGTAAEWYMIKTKNGISYPCNARHRLVLQVEPRKYIQAQQVKVGTKLAGKTIKGRTFLTPVVSIKLTPKPVEVGSYVLSDPSGDVPDGQGMFIAGFSPENDRGLLSSNVKPFGPSET